MLTCGRAMMAGWFPAKDTDAMGPGGPGSYPGFAIPIDMASSQDLVVGWTRDAPVPALTLLSHAWLLPCPGLSALSEVSLRFPAGVRRGRSVRQAPRCWEDAKDAAFQGNRQRQTLRDYDLCRCMIYAVALKGVKRR